jgi:hypothetical protein
MASLLTLPRELRNGIIDILLLTNEPQTKISSIPHPFRISSNVYSNGSQNDWMMFPQPGEHSATGLAQANHQLGAEVLQRSASLRSGIHHRLEILPYGDNDFVARWIDAPIANSRLLNRLDFHIDLSNVIPPGRTSMDHYPSQPEDIIRQATHNVICGCSSSDPAHCRQA